MNARVPAAAASLVDGTVVHHRVRPRAHHMAYCVFSLLIDLERLDEATTACRLFAHNRRALIALYDRDHLSGARDGLAAEARAVFQAAGFDTQGARILLLAYPRVFGFAFNPLSVFYLVGDDGHLRALIYEVRNTFGERKCYVMAAGPARDGVYAQRCDKELFVSPFAPGAGRYAFRIAMTADEVVVGVAFRDAEGPLIRTHFAGAAAPLTTTAAARALARLPLVTFKVVAGIHWEALKLWLKGVPLVRRHRSPRFSISTIDVSRST